MSFNVKEFVEFAKAELQSISGENGAILYSSIETLTTAKILIIGLNPGGSSNETIGGCIEQLQNYYGNAYLDEDWGNGNGKHMLQRNLQLLAEQLQLDLRSICATNLIFKRSKGQSGISYPDDANTCWSVNAKIIEIVRPKVIIAFGNSIISPYDYLKKVCFNNTLEQVKEESFPSGHGSWEIRSFISNLLGNVTIVLGVPHLSRYCLSGKTNQLNWILNKFNDFADYSKMMNFDRDET